MSLVYTVMANTEHPTSSSDTSLPTRLSSYRRPYKGQAFSPFLHRHQNEGVFAEHTNLQSQTALHGDSSQLLALAAPTTVVVTPIITQRNKRQWIKVHGGPLYSRPLPSTKGTRQWRKGDEGWIADSLGKALFNPSNVVALKQHDDEDVMLVLKRHSMVV
nr:hypothetical protein CFP56_42376 [Quercus suber]